MNDDIELIEFLSFDEWVSLMDTIDEPAKI